MINYQCRGLKIENYKIVNLLKIENCKLVILWTFPTPGI
jgi:hypothetical protein